MTQWQGTYAGEWYNGWWGSSLPPANKTIDTPIERTRFMPAKPDASVPARLRQANVPAVVRDLIAHEDPPDMATITFPEKDPDERDDFKLHWTNRLAPLQDTIPSDGSTWEIVSDQAGSANPLNIYDTDVFNSGLSTRVWLEGGVSGQSYELLNTVVTVGGRTLQQTVKVKVKHH